MARHESGFEYDTEAKRPHNRRVSRLSKGLLVVQVALSALLLVGAGLFIRTLYNLQRVKLGFNPENLLVFRLQPERAGYKEEQLVAASTSNSLTGWTICRR